MITENSWEQPSFDPLAVLLRSRAGREARSRELLWEHSPELLLVMDANARIVDVNPAWSALGWDDDSLIGHAFDEFVHPDDAAHFPRLWNRGSDDDRLPTTFERRLRHADGSYRTISWSMFGDDALTSATGRDVSIERMAAAAYEAAIRPCRAQKLEAIGLMTTGLAHDFNNLLSPITQSLELIQRQAGRGEYARIDEHVAVALTAARLAAALARRLLTLSHPRQEGPGPTDINAVVQGIVELVRRTVRPWITVNLSCAKRLWPTLIHADQLETALLNLSINARDAMPDGGALTIATSNQDIGAADASIFRVPAGPYVAIGLTDTGTGMTAEVADRVFEPFFTTKPVGSGTGLGLATVHAFVREAGGHVTVTSRPGHGTKFTLFFPRRDDAESCGRAACDADGKDACSFDVRRHEQCFPAIPVDHADGPNPPTEKK